jgi:hypothetical protein
MPEQLMIFKAQRIELLSFSLSIELENPHQIHPLAIAAVLNVLQDILVLGIIWLQRFNSAFKIRVHVIHWIF